MIARPYAALLVFAATMIAGCDAGTSPAGNRLMASWVAPPEGGGEPEVFGNVYENGARSNRTNLRACIEPLDPATLSRLKGHWVGCMWANPNDQGANAHPKAWAYGWFDPRAANNCGNIEQYEAGNNEGRAYEVHWTNSTLPPDTTQPEGHCIRPGRYTFRVTGPGVNRSFDFEYVGVRVDAAGLIALQIADPVLNTVAIVEPHEYRTADFYSDHVIHVDLTTSTSFPTPAIRLQNVQSAPYASTFTEQSFPTGSEFDWFRFSSHTSAAVTWNLNPQGRALARYHFDLNRPGAPEPFFVDDRNIVYEVLRLHQFSYVTESRKVYVGLELMQPNNLPEQLPAPVRDSINLVRLSPVACATNEAANTWLLTDQILNAGCTTGSPVQYRWRFTNGGAWTSYSSSPTHDFTGHETSGAHTVTLEARNPATGASTFYSIPFTVTGSQVGLSGPTFITQKATNSYTSNQWLYWWERFDQDTQWLLATYEPRNWMNRIWYAGSYTVDLRQEYASGGVLGRGRMHITVCIPCGGGGGQPAPPAGSAAGVASDWGVFGAGPWLSWGAAGSARAVRFYGLEGDHDVLSPFQQQDWLASDSGTAATSGIGTHLRWTRRTSAVTGAQVLRFGFNPPNLDTDYAFGFAVDPDLGSNAADDEAGYDASRGLVYVRDGRQAIGFLLRSATGADAMNLVTQYGLARLPPRGEPSVWNAQRASGVRLMSGRSDVQLVLSDAPRRGASSWYVVVIRGASVAEIQTRADGVLRELVAN